MPECSLLGWLTLIVLTATGIVVGWYAVETQRLRKESQLQTELQSRPFLSLGQNGEGLETRVFVTNVGKGLARNIHIRDVVLSTAIELRAEPITHIAPGADEVPRWRVLASAFVGHPRKEVESTDPGAMAGPMLTKGPGTVVIEYESMVGQLYRTTIHVQQGVATVEKDERLVRRTIND
jgi:hypothetical protein